MSFLSRVKRLLLFPFEMRAQLQALNGEVASLRREMRDRLLQNTLVLTRASRALEARVDGDEEVRLRFEPGQMLVRDAEGIPTGERVAPPPGPWDDAFTDVASEPELTWPGRLRLTIASSCPWWVVYSQPRHAVCVEPQSGPPDALNGYAETVAPGAPMVHRMRWSWTRA